MSFSVIATLLTLLYLIITTNFLKFSMTKVKTNIDIGPNGLEILLILTSILLPIYLIVFLVRCIINCIQAK